MAPTKLFRHLSRQHLWYRFLRFRHGFVTKRFDMDTSSICGQAFMGLLFWRYVGEKTLPYQAFSPSRDLNTLRYATILTL